MAKLVQAINLYGPKIELNPTAKLDQVAEWMAMRTGLNKSEVMMALQEMSEAILFFNTQGTPVKLPGVGTFTPTVDRQGTLKVNFLADKALKNGVNEAGRFSGRMRNRGRVGLDNAGYQQLWDAEHGDDPLEV